MCPSGILPLELSTDERHEQRKESIPDLVKQAAENDVRQVKPWSASRPLRRTDDGKTGSATLGSLVCRDQDWDGPPRLVRTDDGDALQRDLLLSAGYGLNGLFGASQPLPPGRRNQVELGVQPAHS